VIRLALRVPLERADVVLAELIELAPAGVEEVQLDESTVEYAVYGAPGELPSLPDLRALAGGALVEIATTELADDWHERWRQFHRPIAVPAPPGGDLGLRVRPPWEPPDSQPDRHRIEIVVDPGQAFGTGSHATTRLCLGLLLELHAQESAGRGGGSPRPVLDVGTGSGVLAIAAAKLGYEPLLGLDNEAESVVAARENATANGVELEVARYDLREQPLPWLGQARAAGSQPAPGEVLVLANLLRPLLLELERAIARPPAHLIASGLLVAELDEISSAFAARHGMSERARRTEGEWGALLLSSDDAPGAD
jgi:ribosomal protein L11 methyltransferase